MSGKKHVRVVPKESADLETISTGLEFKRVSDDDAKVTDKAFVVVGNVDAGKSTLIGTLTTGILDDGRGSARKGVARHQHEIAAGKTSDVSTRALRFPNGKTATLIDLCGHEKYFTTTASGISGMWPDYAIVVVSPTRGILDMTKQHFRMLMSYNIPVFFVVTRIDMALEESCNIVDKQIRKLCKTYKRNVEFMNSYDKYHAYNRGQKLCDEHGVSATATEIDEDLAEAKGLSDQDVDDMTEFLNFASGKLSCINEINQGLKMASGKQSYIPVVYASNVDGYYLDVVKNSTMSIAPRDLWSRDENANSIVKFFRKSLNLSNLGLDQTHTGSTFYIDKAYNVKGVGLVISGINRGDRISVNDVVYLGPINKSFVKIKLKSFHNDDRADITGLDNHHRGCITIKSLKDDLRKNQIRKGMVLISEPGMIKYVGYRFQAAVTIFGTHSATLRTGYSPVVHAGTIRQAAKLILSDDNLTEEEKNLLSGLTKRERKEKAQCKIKANDVETVWFKFRLRPEFLDPGTVFVFRSGDIHGVGCVVNILPLNEDDDAQPEPVKRKYRRIRPSDQRKVAEPAKKVEKIVVK